jgi:hypothetical protein
MTLAGVTMSEAAVHGLESHVHVHMRVGAAVGVLLMCVQGCGARAFDLQAFILQHIHEVCCTACCAVGGVQAVCCSAVMCC